MARKKNANNLIISSEWPGWLVSGLEKEMLKDQGQEGVGNRHVDGQMGVGTCEDLCITR